MEARTALALPRGSSWQYEPKWDGFRCVAFRDGDEVTLWSKAQKPLSRYFPEVVAALRGLKAGRFVLDGELVLPRGDVLSFDALLQRIHPAETRVRRLSVETPARFVVFDLLVDERGRNLLDSPLSERRAALERFATRFLVDREEVVLSPATADLPQAQRWLAGGAGVHDGVMAKLRDARYLPGLRDAMVKVKRIRTADCVVGGFRYGKRGGVGSLLLGLYDDDGLLHHVGFTSTIPREENEAWSKRLEAIQAAPGFTGRAPGGPSRWSSLETSSEWKPVRPNIVVEVRFDHWSENRFRHGTKLLRRRPDKAPEQCTFAQVSVLPRGAPAPRLRASGARDGRSRRAKS